MIEHISLSSGARVGKETILRNSALFVETLTMVQKGKGKGREREREGERERERGKRECGYVF